jgi:hypothetical protein
MTLTPSCDPPLHRHPPHKSSAARFKFGKTAPITTASIRQTEPNTNGVRKSGRDSQRTLIAVKEPQQHGRENTGERQRAKTHPDPGASGKLLVVNVAQAGRGAPAIVIVVVACHAQQKTSTSEE